MDPRPLIHRPCGLLLAGALAAAIMLLWHGAPSAQTTVFSTDFESGLPAQFSAPGAFIDGVQGYAGLGPPSAAASSTTRPWRCRIPISR